MARRFKRRRRSGGRSSAVVIREERHPGWSRGSGGPDVSSIVGHVQRVVRYATRMATQLVLRRDPESRPSEHVEVPRAVARLIVNEMEGKAHLEKYLKRPRLGRLSRLLGGDQHLATFSGNGFRVGFFLKRWNKHRTLRDLYFKHGERVPVYAVLVTRDHVYRIYHDYVKRRAREAGGL